MKGYRSRCPCIVFLMANFKRKFLKIPILKHSTIFFFVSLCPSIYLSSYCLQECPLKRIVARNPRKIKTFFSGSCKLFFLNPRFFASLYIFYLNSVFFTRKSLKWNLETLIFLLEKSLKNKSNNFLQEERVYE